MPLQLPLSTEKVFRMTKADPTETTTVTIRQASQEAVSSLGDMISRVDRTREGDTYTTFFNPAESQLRQVWHTMVACDIEVPGGGKPLFPSKNMGGYHVLDMTEAQFRKAWNSLPPEWASEIVELMYEQNPMWDYRDRDEESPKS